MGKESLTFLWHPWAIECAVRWLRHWRVGRVPAVILAVLFAFLVISGFAFAIGDEVIGLAQKLPEYEQNIVTPVLYRDTLIFSGTGNPVMGVKVLKRGAQWTTETVWQNKDFSMYMSSPVVSGGLLFGFGQRWLRLHEWTPGGSMRPDQEGRRGGVPKGRPGK